jgi:lambda family phage portal protein
MFDIFKRKQKKTISQGHDLERSFASAEVDAILGPWRWDNGFSNTEIAGQLATLRSRSREMSKNSPHYKRFLELFVCNVVGNGFSFKSLASKSKTDFSIDDETAKFLSNHWWRWGSIPARCDETGRKNLVGILQLCAENWARDGEFFIHINKNAQNIYGITLRVIRPDACDETINGTYDGRIIRNGVEVDPETLKPVAYWFNAQKEDQGAAIIAKKPRKRIPASEIIHGFTQHDECQTRGIPHGHAVLAKLKMLEEYDKAELVAARDEANTLGAFYAPAGRDGEIGKWSEGAKSAVRSLDSKPGTKLLLPQGWEYKNHTPQHPNREVTAFKNTMLRDVASGLGLEYACFANDWGGVSYSSVRQGTLAERDMWQMYQERFIVQCLDRIYAAWLRSILKLAISGDLVESSFDYIYDHEFRGRRWGWVDPLKDVNASVIAVQHGWKTNEQIAADFGTDYFENVEALGKELSAQKEAGVVSEPNDDETNPEKEELENEEV